MAESSRNLTSEWLQMQASVVGLDLSVVDADALLDRVTSGLDDLERLDELRPDSYEPAVKFEPGQCSQ
jgi:hypothetical protein